MAPFIVDTFWPVVAITIVALGVIGLAWLLRPELRQHHRLRAAEKIVAVLLIIEVVFIPVYFFALIEDMPRWW